MKLEIKYVGRNTKSVANALIPVNAQMLALGPGSLATLTRTSKR